MQNFSLRLGLDIGSTTMKLALIADKDELTLKDNIGKKRIEVLYTDYQRHNADPLKTGNQMLGKLQHWCTKTDATFDNATLHVAITGSVGMGYAERLNLPFVQEVIAAAEVVQKLYPETRTMVDIGGEDAKMIFFEPGRIPDMRMNGNCAGGTGAFIDQTATLLGIETNELNDLALQAEHIYPIASRCGVFSKTDIQNLLSKNVSKQDVAASMLNAVGIQVVSALAHGTDITPKIFLCGGPFAYIPELKKYLLKAMQLTESDAVVPEYPQFVPAIGTALLANRCTTSIAQLISLFSQTDTAPNLTSTLPPLFAHTNDYKQWLQSKQNSVPIQLRKQSSIAPDEPYFLGVDSGSTTTKLVLIDKEAQIVYHAYSYNAGNPLLTFQNMLTAMYQSVGCDIEIANSCSTGYGEQLLKTAFNLQHGIVETMAHFMAARHLCPDVSFVLDIGGQDMKAIFAENGSIQRIEVNEACSSGCGSFLLTFSKQLGYSADEFDAMALTAIQPYDLGTRCTVFMNSKVKQAMREGARIDDIAAGFSYSVIKNCLYKVLKLHNVSELGKYIVVQGGTMKNHSVVRALELLTGCQVAFSAYPELMGAYGAALTAMNSKL